MKSEESESYQFIDLFADDQTDKLDILSTNLMKDISKDFRQSYRQSIAMKKSESMDFDEKLSLDIAIDKFIEVLENTKIKLLEFEDPNLILNTAATQQFKNIFQQSIHKYQKTILLRQAQIGSLVFLMQNRKQTDFEENYLRRYGNLEDYIINVQDAYKQINIFVLEEAIQMEIQFFEEYSDMMDLLKLNIVHKKYLGDMNSLITNANRLKIINSKIVTIAEIFPYACTLDKDDLFSFPKTHQRWKKLQIQRVFYGESKKIRDSFKKLKSGLNLVNATMNLLHQSKEHWGNKNWYKLWEISGKIMKCAVFQKDATHQAEVLISDPDSKLAKQIWNLPQQKMFRNVINSILPSIAYSQQFWIPRIFGEYLKLAKLQNNLPIVPELEIKDTKSYITELFKQKDYQQRIPMRINCPYPIKLKDQTENAGYMSMFSSMFKKKTKVPMAVIYHIHGGGFISMSSFIHQTYTRVWANNLQVPIISIDYGKAPEHPFPEGLNDCFEGYMWTLYQFRQIYQTEPVKVILVGDSAGGNLVAALTNLLISCNLRLPDGIVLVYPALNLTYKNYTPSLLTALNDMILPHTFLKVCLESYIRDQNLQPNKDPLLSPIVADNKTLTKYPPTRIFVGSRDPFHDDCCRLVQKLNQLKPGNASLMIFDEFPHGFLQFDMKTQPHQECRKATKQVQNTLKELLFI